MYEEAFKNEEMFSGEGEYEWPGGSSVSRFFFRELCAALDGWDGWRGYLGRNCSEDDFYLGLELVRLPHPNPV